MQSGIVSRMSPKPPTPARKDFSDKNLDPTGEQGGSQSSGGQSSDDASKERRKKEKDKKKKSTN